MVGSSVARVPSTHRYLRPCSAPLSPLCERLIVAPLSLLAALCLLPAVPAHAGGGDSSGDRFVVSGPLDVPRGERVGDAVTVDGRVRLAGRATGDVVAVSGPVRVSGTIEGDLVAVSDRARLAPGARVEGDVIYGDERPVIASGAAVGGDVKKFEVDEVLAPLGGFFGRLALWIAFSVSTLVAGLLLYGLAPRALDAARAAARDRAGGAVGFGLLIFFGVPILAILVFLTIVGIPLAIALVLAVFPLYLLGYVTSAWLLGRRLVARRAVLGFLAGWGILRVLALVPVLGGLLWFGATVFGLGALGIAAWRARSGRATAPAPA
jgi:cytoskeletal protein CcmA (bactofilin family)